MYRISILINMSNEDYKKQCKEVHNGFFSYEKTEFSGLCSKVIITCPKHGDFTQRAGFHLSGRKCIKCAASDRAAKRAKESAVTFIGDCDKVHKSFYDYSKVNYIDSKTKVCITCPIHGEFWQTPTNHLRGHGCPSCGAIKIGRRVSEFHKNKRPVIKPKGIPDGASAVPLGTNGEYFIVSLSDYDTVSAHAWYKNSYGYVVNNKLGLIHRFLLGVSDPRVQVDHIDHDKLNNTRDNLRQCSHAENSKNRPKGKGGNTYKGVTWNAENKRWVVHICSDGHQMHVGTFTDEVEAARAYDAAAKKYHKDFAYLNFPND